MKPFKNNVLFTALTVFMFLMLPLICFADKLNSEFPETNTTEEAVQLFIQGREAFEMGRTADAIVYFEKLCKKISSLLLPGFTKPCLLNRKWIKKPVSTRLCVFETMRLKVKES